MPGVVYTAALQGLEEVPGGSVLSSLIGGLFDEIDRQKALRDKLETLRHCLPERLAKLEQCVGHEELVEKIVAQVEAFNVFVQGCELSRILFFKRANRKEFEVKLEIFTTEMKELKDLVPVRTLDLTAQTNQTSNETLGNVKEVDRKVGELADGFNSVLPMLEARLTDSPHGSETLSASEFGEQLQATLDKLRGGSDVEEAQKALVRIALELVREDNNELRTVGVRTLDELVAHPNARNSVMANPSTVPTLINLHQVDTKKAQWLLERLVERAAPFFEQLELLSRIPKYLPTIAATGLAPWIVESAKPMFVTQGRLHKRIGDENALRILLVMAKCDECKPAIAEAGGISALVDTYPLLTMSAEEVHELPLVIDVISALVGLAEDATCRAQFARAHGEWPLLHFVYRCATIPPRKYKGDYPECGIQDEIDEMGNERDTEPMAFDRRSVQEDTSKAGHALWELTTQDDGWKRRVLYLGASNWQSLHDFGDGDMKDVDCAVVESLEKRPRIDAILGWLCMALYIEKRRNDYRYMYSGCRGAFWSFPIVWSLLMDDATSFTVAEWCFGELRRSKDELRWFGPCQFRNSFAGTSWSELLSQSEDKLTSSISSYLALPTCKNLRVCWKKILLEANKSDRKDRSLSVLWVCGDLVKSLGPSDLKHLEEVCEEAVASGRVDDVFWAVCLLLSPNSSCAPAMVSRMLALAMTGVELLLKSADWDKFVFLAKYMLLWEAVHKQGPCSAPFLVTCFVRLRDEREEWLDDDSYFQTKSCKKLKKAMKKCLRWLGQLWPEYKTQIVKEGGAATLQAMLDCTKVDDKYKRDIRQELHAIATERGSSLTADAAAP